MKLTALLMVLALVACSNDNSSSNAPEKPVQKEELIIQPQLDALKKSKQVQSTLDQAEQTRRQTIEAQGI